MFDRRLFTSESVTEGHPDKIADQISDAVLDAILADDPAARVATLLAGLIQIGWIAGQVAFIVRRGLGPGDLDAGPVGVAAGPALAGRRLGRRLGRRGVDRQVPGGHRVRRARCADGELDLDAVPDDPGEGLADQGAVASLEPILGEAVRDGDAEPASVRYSRQS